MEELDLSYYLSWTGLVVAWFCITGGLWKLADRAEKSASDEAKKKASEWLKGLQFGKGTQGLAITFMTAFDSVFGKKLRSWRTFGKSFIASIIAVIISISLVFWLKPEGFLDITTGRGTVFLLIGVLSGSSFFNVIPDYLSLVESRIVIGWMEEREGVLWTLGILLLDVLFTAFIFLGSFFFGYSAFFFFGNVFMKSHGITMVFPPMEYNMLSETLDIITFGYDPPGDASVSPFFYSTFFTSVWVWLYALSGLLVKISKVFNKTGNILLRFFDVDEKPFYSIAGISILIVTVIFVVVAVVKMMT